MKYKKLFIAIAVLVLASLACKTVMGGGAFAPSGSGSDGSTGPTIPGGSGDSGGGGGSSTSVSSLPKPSDATNVIDLGNDTITLSTKMSLKDTMSFYKDALGKQGYKQNDTYTAVTDTTFSIVFDGDPSGKKLVVQGVTFSGSTTVTLTLQSF